MRELLLVAVAMVLSGCAVNSGVRTLYEDVLYVSRQGATGASSQTKLRQVALGEAQAHCAASGARFELVELVEAKPPFILGNFPRAEVRFRCRSAS